MTTETEKPKNLLFVRSVIDDAGLTPNEFRLMCHFARRGTCYSSLATIGYVTEMSVRTVQKTLKFLVEEELVLKEPHPGRQDIYRLPDPGTLTKKLQSGRLKERKEESKKKFELKKSK
ncbi:helix-turn-helix domain-containing protein [Calothrix rhizosoleniae]|uniref:helix-turn-helix domain-containing protein n=1 Tax=Calothrix rhizosoleniae TaxID=888997 RepID=UPI000B497C4A|nr:helix-turn-helix domain-containing protein [Calothrix rhizosoleniae]